MANISTDKHVALVGIGRWGQRILKTIAPMVDSVTCVSLGNSENMQHVKSSYPDVEIAEDYNSVLNNTSIDAVIIATPIATHADIARRALNVGKHVFVEKPLATSTKEIDELYARAEKKGVLLFTGYIYLYHPAFGAMRDYIAENSVDSFSATWEKHGTFNEDILWNLFSHDLATATALFGSEPQKVELQEARGVQTALDIIHAIVTFEGEKKASFRIDRTAPEKRKIVEIQQGNTTLKWEGDGLFIRTEEGEEYKKLPTMSERTPLERELAAFFESTQDPKGEEMQENKDISRAVTKAIENLQKSTNGTL